RAATLSRARRHNAIIAFAKEIQRGPVCFERSRCRFQNSDQFQAGTAAGRRLHSAFVAIDKMLALYLQRFLLLNVGNIAVPVMIGVMKLGKGMVMRRANDSHVLISSYFQWLQVIDND